MTVATIIGTLVAFLLVPMRSLGQDNWKIAAALMGCYIGGCKCQDVTVHLLFRACDLYGNNILWTFEFLVGVLC